MDKLIFGLSATAVGMIIVFLGLAILIGFIALLKITDTHKKKEIEVAIPKQEEIVDRTAIDHETSNDESLIAVIAASVAAMINAEEENTSAFIVRRIQRVHNAPAWQKAGREEQTYSRL